MDAVSPFSLLEVTMSEENNPDDDCIIIDDDDDDHDDDNDTPVYNGSNASCQVTTMEVEVDPLLVGPSVAYDCKQNDMPTLWVTTNITNLASVAHAETAYRKSQYSNVHEVLTEILHCTICLDHVGCDIRMHPSSIEHPVLRVLICEHCACTYKTVNFIMNDKGKEINCRWCGKGASTKGTVLRTCQQCPFSFCELCLHKNCPEYFTSEPGNPWTCIACNIQVLWPARATLWALHCLKSLLLSNPGNSLGKINGDISLCCKNKKKKKKRVTNVVQTLDRSDSFDLNQLILPHLLNEPNEMESSSAHLPEMIFPSFTSSFPRIALKQKAKPRPRPKPKPKPKSKTSVASSHSVTVPAAMPSELEPKTELTVNKKPHWLRQKLFGYINDFNQLKMKLEDIEKSLDLDENDPRTEEKVDNVTTLLSLHRELLNSCRLSLINEWKERKARLVLEKYSSESNGVTEIIKLGNDSSKPVNDYKNTYHPIKQCYVKLKRLELPLERFRQGRKQKI